MNTPRWQIWLRNGLTAIFVIYCAAQAYGYAFNNQIPDPMMFSGSATCLLGFWLGIGVRQRMHAVIDALRQSGVLMVNQAQLIALHVGLEAQAARQARWGAAIVGIAECALVISGVVLVPRLAFHLKPFSRFDPMLFLALLTIGGAAGALVGWLLGQFAGYSLLPQTVRAVGGDLALLPDAADGVGGLRPLVTFVRRQAALTLLPVAWIGSWLVLTVTVDPFWNRYGFWRFPFLLMFGLSVFYGERGFLRPTVSIQQLFDNLAAAAERLGDTALSRRAAAARQRIWPGPGSFLAVIAVLAVAILAFGLRTGVGGFLFGPPPAP